MSCSDKITRWLYLGLQGAVLSSLVVPIYVHSLVVGEYFDRDALERAFNERLEGLTVVDNFSAHRVSSVYADCESHRRYHNLT